MKPKQVVDDLNPTENGEAGEETHCASNQAKRRLCCHLQIKIVKININFRRGQEECLLCLFALNGVKVSIMVLC